MKKHIFAVFMCVTMFGIFGIYLTFFDSNVAKYDSQTKAYKIEPNEIYDSEDGTAYYPIYYYRVNNREYQCKSKGGSSFYPKESKNTVYYKEANPADCKTEYEKSTGKVAGIICLVVTAIVIYIFIIKSPNGKESFEHVNNDTYPNSPIDEESQEEVMHVIGKISLIYKRVILGIIIIVLLVLTLFDTVLFKQTLKARNYIDATATYQTRESDDRNERAFDDAIYTFNDKDGLSHEVVVSITKENTPKEEIKIKYNPKDPTDYYEEGATLDKSGLIWYTVKVVALILLILLFFNKKLLSKLSLSVSSSSN